MIDIHTHILPGVDDGPAELAESIAMARRAVEDGITRVVATPHYLAHWHAPPVVELMAARDRLCAALEREGVALDVRVAAEVQMVEDLAARIRSGAVPTLDGGGRYVLLELPRVGNCAPSAAEMVFRLRLSEITPVIAHPEYCETFLADPTLPSRLVDQGALFQLTAGSVVREAAGGRQGLALHLLCSGLVHAIASDAHDLTRRPPVLSPARQVCAALLGEASAALLVSGNPARLLAGEDVVPLPPLDDTKTPNRRDGALGAILETLRRIRGAASRNSS